MLSTILKQFWDTSFKTSTLPEGQRFVAPAAPPRDPLIQWFYYLLHISHFSASGTTAASASDPQQTDEMVLQVAARMAYQHRQEVVGLHLRKQAAIHANLADRPPMHNPPNTDPVQMDIGSALQTALKNIQSVAEFEPRSDDMTRCMMCSVTSSAHRFVGLTSVFQQQFIFCQACAQLPLWPTQASVLEEYHGALQHMGGTYVWMNRSTFTLVSDALDITDSKYLDTLQNKKPWNQMTLQEQFFCLACQFQIIQHFWKSDQPLVQQAYAVAQSICPDQCYVCQAEVKISSPHMPTVIRCAQCPMSRCSQCFGLVKPGSTVCESCQVKCVRCAVDCSGRMPPEICYFQDKVYCAACRGECFQFCTGTCNGLALKPKTQCDACDSKTAVMNCQGCKMPMPGAEKWRTLCGACFTKNARHCTQCNKRFAPKQASHTVCYACVRSASGAKSTTGPRTYSQFSSSSGNAFQGQVKPQAPASASFPFKF